MKEEATSITRRNLLGGAAASGLALALGRGTSAQTLESTKLFRFVFMPCIHFRPDLRSPEGLATALKAVEGLNPKPDFIITGGDVCHNLRDETIEASEKRLDEFKRVWDDNTLIKTYHALGNHEIPGWGKPAVPESDVSGGFKLPVRKLGMPGTSYSFEHKGWQFIVAHNVVLLEQGKLTGKFNPDVLDLVKSAVADNKTKPTVVVSHIPIVTVTEFFSGRATLTDNVWSLPAGRLVGNPQAILDALEGANFKLALSGHIHRVDDISFLGHRFICSGAVSGAQWNGPDHETQPGFGIIDCMNDGTFSFQYHEYGWKF